MAGLGVAHPWATRVASHPNGGQGGGSATPLYLVYRYKVIIINIYTL
jgi:hypothetical protein